MDIPQRKVLLIGPSGIGKTRAVQELLHPNEEDSSIHFNGSNQTKNNISLSQLAQLGMATPSTLDWKYYPTLGVELEIYVEVVGDVPIQFNLWDIAGNQDPQVYTQNTDFFVVLTDEEHEQEYTAHCGTVPYRVIRERNMLHDTLVDMA